MLNLADYRTETDKATTIMRMQIRLDAATAKIERLTAALSRISEMPYDDKEEEKFNSWDETKYMQLTWDDCSTYLSNAVDIAYVALVKG